MAELVAWNYGETSGPVLDRTGNGRNFTLTGTSTRTAAGNGYTYGGTRPNTKGLTQASAEVQVGPSLTGLEPAAWTVATWAKAGAADPSWFLEWYRATDTTGVRGWLTLSGSLRGRIKNPANTAFEQPVTADGANWHYFAMTHDGTNLRVYRDTGGTVALIGSVAAAFTPWSATELRIFDNSNSGCVLSETRILNTALTLAELQTLSQTPVEDAAPVSGALSANLPGFTGSLTGNAEVRGDAAGPIPGFVGALSGAVTVEASGAGVLPAVVGSFTGSVDAEGGISGPLPGFVGSFTGGVGSHPAGSFAASLPRLVGALVGHVDAGPAEPTLPVQLAGVVVGRWDSEVRPNRYRTEVHA